MTTMTYGQLAEAYVAVREERDRLRADDLAIRRLLRDCADPLPAVVAETLDGVRRLQTAIEAAKAHARTILRENGDHRG